MSTKFSGNGCTKALKSALKSAGVDDPSKAPNHKQKPQLQPSARIDQTWKDFCLLLTDAGLFALQHGLIPQSDS